MSFLHILDRWQAGLNILCHSLHPMPLDVLTLERWGVWELTVFKAQQGCSHSSHTHTFIHPKILIRTHPYSTQMQGGTGQRSNASDEREERRRDNQTSAVSHHTADRDDRQEWSDRSFCAQLAWKPIETLVETVSTSGTRGLDIPATVTQVVQA